MLVSEDGEGAGFDGEVAGGIGGKAKPVGHKDPKQVSVGEKKRILPGLFEAGEDPPDPPAHLLDRLSFGGSIPKKIPAGAFPADLDGRAPFVEAIVPFHEVGIQVEPVSETCKHSGLPGPGKRA